MKIYTRKPEQVLLEALKGILRQAVFSGLNYIFVLDIIDSAREAIAIAEEEPPQTESEQIKDCNKFMSKDSIYRCKNCGELVNEFDYYDRYREIGCPNCDCLEFMQISKTIQGDE